MKNLKGYFIGALIGASIMFSFQSFAASDMQSITAYLHTMNVTLDGKAVNLEKPVINYNDSNYVNIRDISKISGKVVAWNETTQTIDLSSLSLDKEQIRFSDITSNLTIPTKADNDIFYNESDIDANLASHNFVSITFMIKNGNHFIQYNDKTIPIIEDTDSFTDEGNTYYLSRSIFMQIFSDKYLSSFQEYSVNRTSKNAMQIN